MKLCFLFFFLLLSIFISLSSSNPDSIILLKFKKSSDLLSNKLTSWSNSSNPCSGSWVGVTCNNNGDRVTRLVLENLHLTGSIETLSHLHHLRLLSLKNNTFSSSSSSLNFSSWRNMKLLYLSHNNFTGDFPSGLSHLHRLRRLDLSHNFFSGEIPVGQLSQLPYLVTLRLEANSFSGLSVTAESEQEQQTLNFLDFNVSSNNLSGEIPKPLTSFPVSSFIGNENLCGNPLPKRCFRENPYPSRVPNLPGNRDGKKKLSLVTVLAVTITDVCLFIGVVFGILVYCRKRKLRIRNQNGGEVMMKKKGYGHDYGSGYLERRRRSEEEEEEMVVFQGCKGFGVEELLKSSAELLGKGCVGSTYKVVMMGSGDVVVVKRARETRKKKEVDGLLREIGGLRHCNLVSLRAYYCSKDELLLVYDFLPNGSLHSLLHGNRGPGRTPLEWTTRLKYAADAAEGLAFLHSANKSKLCHGHLTSSNIIVDHKGNACISDVALHQLFPAATPSNNGYKAPELIPSGNVYRKFTHKCDVYSFGVILLEILTGKTAMEGGEMSLAKWVQCVVREEWTSEVFDIELLRHKEIEEEMVTLLQIALLCLSPMPVDRPKMSVIHKMIEDIRTKGSRRRTPSPSFNDLSSDSSPSLSDGTHNLTSV